jgi:hypothetical protein
MRWTSGSISILLCLLAVASCANAQKGHPAKTAEPSVFSIEEENGGFENAVVPSNAVLDALLETPEAKDIDWDHFTREQERKLFQTVKIHLADSSEVDEIVSGSGPMSGADNDWFWLVRDQGRKAEVLLFANGLSLQLRRTRCHGYRDIETSWSSAAGYVLTVRYRYDGVRYRKVSERSSQMRLP